MEIGCQINLDNGEGRILAGKIVDCILNPCTTLNISFISPWKCIFRSDSSCYFTYNSIDWIAEVYDEGVSTESQFIYNVVAIPRNAYNNIITAYSDACTLGNAAGLSFIGDNVDFDICPLNFNLVQTMQMQMLYMFEKGYNEQNIMDSAILYCDSKNFHSQKLSNILLQKSKELNTPYLMQGQSKIKFSDDTIRQELASHRNPENWTLLDYFNRLFINKFEIAGTQNYLFLNSYTIAFDDTDSFNLSGKYVLVRNEMNLTKADGSICTFAKFREF